MGKIAKVVDGALIMGDWAYKMYDSDYDLDIVVYKLMPLSSLRSKDKGTLFQKYIYAKTRIKELVDEGKISYDKDLIDTLTQDIASYNITSNKKDIQNLVDEIGKIFGND
ncbi:hypothetical protein SK3146_05752 [Paenibacillus konkukensis]|uniref:Polymerase beta nucleotidyltransferase domain-containing protein n=1 Tax=Paenibacillus konkukensis TaxID=2020716 RepID=A0ABY4RYJ3_9BACL|nr:hypothetical protein SK3146_05752 [Paenibacillus konkukensis]